MRIIIGLLLTALLSVGAKADCCECELKFGDKVKIVGTTSYRSDGFREGKFLMNQIGIITGAYERDGGNLVYIVTVCIKSYCGTGSFFASSLKKLEAAK